MLLTERLGPPAMQRGGLTGIDGPCATNTRYWGRKINTEPGSKINKRTPPGLRSEKRTKPGSQLQVRPGHPRGHRAQHTGPSVLGAGIPTAPG